MISFMNVKIKYNHNLFLLEFKYSNAIIFEPISIPLFGILK